jgi:protein SCO1/2
MTVLNETILRRTVVTLVIAMTLFTSGRSQTTQERGSQTASPFSALPEFVVLDQDGRRVRFYTDLIKGKVVVLSFFYTDCSFVCDGQGRNFAKLQSLLGDRLGRDIFLISVTRTPLADTPKKLKAWGRRFRLRAGWTLVTGKTPDIARLLATFAGDNLGAQEMHSAPILIGNDVTGLWLNSSGLSAPEELLKLINRVSERTQALLRD